MSNQVQLKLPCLKQYIDKVTPDLLFPPWNPVEIPISEEHTTYFGFAHNYVATYIH